MNKQELIDKAVESRRGLIGEGNESADWVVWDGNEFYLVTTQFAKAHAMGEADIICDIDEFKKRAHELGWIDGYKWGVEYPTDDKKPDLDDDVKVAVKFDGKWEQYNSKSDAVGNWMWGKSQAFRIIDERYKPVAELVKDGLEICKKIEERLTSVDNSWFPRHDTNCEYSDSDFEGWRKCKYIGINTHGSKKFAVLFDSEKGTYVNPKICADLKFRPIKTERERFIEATTGLKIGGYIITKEAALDLYDLWFKAATDKVANL